MVTKKRSTNQRATKKPTKKTKPVKSVKARKTPKNLEKKKPVASAVQVIQISARVDLPVVERSRVTIGTIRGDTIIGDLLVAFPRTRDVLVRTGLRLEAEDAGDIYMTLDAFSAMNDLKSENLVLEIVEVAKEPVPQSVAPQLAAAPAV
jgi:hypothetical protein